MKYIVIVPDGMADLPLEELSGKTPLEAAHTQNMDFLARNGNVGMIKTIPDGLKPGSEIGNLSLLGYDPKKVFSGRAPLEAANLGIELADDEIAFRCNLVTVMDKKMVDYSAGHIKDKEAALIIDTLNERMEAESVRFYPGKSYRHIMVIKVRDIKESRDIKCTPPHDIMGKEIDRYLPEGPGSKILLKLMEKSRIILADHPVNNVRVDLKENPANLIWLWGQGIKPALPSFKEKYGVDGGIISAVDLVNGIGRLAGLDIIKVPGITGYYDTNYLGKAEYALNALKTKNFVYIHIEAPDEAGHNGDAKAKMECIEKIDREIIGTILTHFDAHEDVRILVLPDHPTPVSLRTHTREPVGFVMYGKGIPLDTAETFNETTAKLKGLKYQSGEALMEFFMNKYL
ncbi:MAG: cofactor-independent phosphoglycerate mutase [Candidatus Omnitrophota bacterium]|jgi:2,3-bisphosphoglycerate-independent phosphoglycerate mutase